MRPAEPLGHDEVEALADGLGAGMPEHPLRR
jgi:hypothetical protein